MFFVRSFDFIFYHFNQIISFLINRILPGFNSTRIEYQILKSYFLIVISLSSLTLLFKLFRFFHSSKFKSNQTLLSSQQQQHHHQSIVDIYIDFNHFNHQFTYHSIHHILLQFKSIVHQSLQHHDSLSSSSLKLVYWSYINRDRLELSDWIHQLDQLESHFPHGFLQVIDTSQSPIHSKPLLSDLLRILNASPPGRLYVISTSDPDLYTSGIQFMKYHPNSPLLAYIPPHGYLSKVSESISHVDYLFAWEKDETVSLVEDLKNRPKLDFSSASLKRAFHEFEPLKLILQAFSPSHLPLESLKDYLKPWCSQFNRLRIDNDETVMKYIDSALDNEIISFLDESTSDEENPTRLVVYLGKSSHPRHSQVGLATSDAIPSILMEEKPGFDDDNLTTTGSRTSSRSRPAQSTPSRASTTSSDHLLSPRQSQSTLAAVITEPDQTTKPISTPSKNLVKHKHHTMDLTDLTDRLLKKNKTDQSSTELASTSIVRSGTNSNLLKKKIRNKPTRSVVSNFINPIQSESIVPKQDEKQYEFSPSTTIVKSDRITQDHADLGPLACYDGKLGLKSANDLLNEERQKCDDRNQRIYENVVSSEPRQDLFKSTLATVWLNCSSGIMMNSMFTNSSSDRYQFKRQASSFIGNRSENPTVSFNLSLISLNNCHLNHFEQNEGENSVTKSEDFILQDRSKLVISSSHLHFKSFFIPAMLKLDSSSQPQSPTILNLKVHLQIEQDNSSPITPFDLNQVD